ncbi:hypothetical protein OHB04_02520 [Streptomyces sp. NBC_01775]|uniref:hypothetical protein n=1 Tax=Streptomyces sp. NBC_01775 TaxID=2975939 RepID=UPI002DDB7D4A|nr:hypothetical protein [Streptomyces sp. NBC_01775]WSB74768.1 hypothetical protein OHB04_02520 [Streptomyces sp. NBC_01775]
MRVSAASHKSHPETSDQQVSAFLPLPRIASAPLPDLLASVNGEIVVLDELDDPNLFGGIVERRDTGRVLFAMPPRRPTGERERCVRVLLAHREGYSRDQVRSAFAGGCVA